MKKNTQKEAQHLLKSAGVVHPPVPVEKLAERLKAKLSFEPFEGHDEISGILYRDERRVVIGINSSHAKTRQRFSIAHEIGHLLLHDGDLFVDKTVRLNFRSKKSSLAEDTQEIEANQFAAELLMPREMIEREIKKRADKRKSVSEDVLAVELASVFEVSKQAMEYRLINLGIVAAR